VGSSVSILYQIHPGVICAHRGGRPQGQNLGIFRQLYRLRGCAPGQIGPPAGGSTFDGREELSSNHECPDINPFVVHRALQVIDGPDLLESAEYPECHLLILNPDHPQAHGSKQRLYDHVLQPSEGLDGFFGPFAHHSLWGGYAALFQ